MTIQRLGFLAMVTFAMLAGQQLANAQRPNSTDRPDPEKVAKRCVDSINHLADRCVEATKDTTHQCIRKIRELLKQGEVEEARHVARHCMKVIKDRTDDCIDAIHHRCRHCIRLLLRLHAPELARRLHHTCEHVVDHVRNSQRRAFHAIKSQFDGGDPTN